MERSASLIEHLDNVTDPRTNKVTYPLTNILFMTICALITDGQVWCEEQTVEIRVGWRLPCKSRVRSMTYGAIALLSHSDTLANDGATMGRFVSLN